jgi:hypothetical protein
MRAIRTSGSISQGTGGESARQRLGLRGVVQGAIHLTLELNQWPILFRLCAPLGPISVARLYAHVLAIVDEPQTSTTAP